MEPDLLQQARAEADAIVNEAREQARLLQEAAERVRRSRGQVSGEVAQMTHDLIETIEKTISSLNEVAEELRRQID